MAMNGLEYHAKGLTDCETSGQQDGGHIEEPNESRTVSLAWRNIGISFTTTLHMPFLVRVWNGSRPVDAAPAIPHSADLWFVPYLTAKCAQRPLTFSGCTMHTFLTGCAMTAEMSDWLRSMCSI